MMFGYVRHTVTCSAAIPLLAAAAVIHQTTISFILAASCVVFCQLAFSGNKFEFTRRDLAFFAIVLMWCVMVVQPVHPLLAIPAIAIAWSSTAPDKLWIPTNTRHTA